MWSSSATSGTGMDRNSSSVMGGAFSMVYHEWAIVGFDAFSLSIRQEGANGFKTL